MKLVTAQELSRVWPRVEHWIANAVKENQGDESLLDVLIACARGAYLLFEADTYVVIGQVQHFPQQTVGMILYCGGTDLQAISQGFEDGKRWAKANGIDVLRTHGRSGWAKALQLPQVGVILQVKL